MQNEWFEKLQEICPQNRTCIKEKRSFFEHRDEWRFTPNIEKAFFLPSDLTVLAEKKELILSLVSSEIYELKQKALRGITDTEVLQRLQPITDPYATEREFVKLLLLETIFLLKRHRIAIVDIEKCHPFWIEIADHFGLWKYRYRIEDTLFSILRPVEYALFVSLQKKGRKHQDLLFQELKDILTFHLEKKGITNFEILYRKKNLFGLYQKMKLKGKNLNHITDLLGFRILVPTEGECYVVLETLHYLWPAHKNLMKDYIKDPKPNGYQSLHTTLRCLHQNTIEFQIRTYEMDQIAKLGPANHADYKKKSRKISV